MIYPEKVLRTPGKQVKDINDEVRAVAARMIELMYEAEGIGLAAPQVGLSWQMFVLDVPLGEETELYDVEIMNGATVVRTISSLTSATASYSAANQVIDFGSPQASLTVKIYQRSTTFGRGVAGEATV